MPFRERFVARGLDTVSGKTFEHRRTWIQNRLQELAASFGIDCLSFAVMVNHVHVILRNRPDVVALWSDEEVAKRWWQLFPLRKINVRVLLGGTL